MKPELDLEPFEHAWAEHQSGKYNNIGLLNLEAWLGERAHFLMDEIKRLRAEIVRLDAPVVPAARGGIMEIQAAIREMVRLGNVLNWNPPIDQKYADAINGLRGVLAAAQQSAQGNSPLCPECETELHLTTTGEHVCRNEACDWEWHKHASKGNPR